MRNCNNSASMAATARRSATVFIGVPLPSPAAVCLRAFFAVGSALAVLAAGVSSVGCGCSTGCAESGIAMSAGPEFPRFLETNASTLSADELGRYHKQQSLVGQILAAYEQTPGGTDRIAVLMQQMQECGPPPPQIAGPMGDNAGCSIS